MQFRVRSTVCTHHLNAGLLAILFAAAYSAICCRLWNTVSVLTCDVSVCNLNRRVVGPVVGDFAQQLMPISSRVNLCIHALCNHICKEVLSRSVVKLNYEFSTIEQRIQMCATNWFARSSRCTFDHTALTFAASTDIKYQFCI